MNWFEQLTGFPEEGYAQTQARFRVEGERLHSLVNDRSWHIGRLETPSLAALRVRAAGVPPKHDDGLRVRTVVADAHALHTWPEAHGALVQVASQFNLLEMPSPHVTPEHGVSGYQHDPTQGPACARAAGAGTLYRNYFAPVGDQIGQTRTRQIDTLADLRVALSRGHEIEMHNGYAFASKDVLHAIRDQLAGCDETTRDQLRGLLRVGLHHDVEVTAAGAPSGQRVSQAYCSALPVQYNDHTDPQSWAPFAQLVLEAAYEATLLAAVLNAAANHANPRVYLTQLGGGVFGNQRAWIVEAIRRSRNIVRQHALDVCLVSYGDVPEEMQALAAGYGA